MRNHILRLFAVILFSVIAGNIYAQDIDTCCVGEKEVYWVENYDATSTYDWSLKYGNGTLQNALRPDSVYVLWTAVGLDSVICVETNADACIGPDNKLAVETFPAPVFVDYTGGVSYCEGDDISITVNGTPLAVLTYQWFFNGAEIVGATTSTLAIAGSTAANSGVYFCRLSTDCDDIDSDNLDVTVDIAPVITTQPTAATNMCPNTNLALSVAATGTAPISYQWQFDNGGGFVNMDGVANPSALTNSLTVVNATIANNEGDYRCVVTNGCGSTTSDVASVNIWEQVVITSVTITGSLDNPPADTLWVNPGSGGTITVNTTGEDLTYVWQDNLANVIGGDNPLLTLTNLQQVNSGDYKCTVSNDCGSEVANIYVGIVEFPVINPQPLDHQICSDDALTLFINATGPQPLRYQWEHSTDDATWNIINPALNSTAATNTLKLESVEADSAGYYRCATWNQRWGDVTYSNSAEITLTQRPVLSGVDTAWATVNAPFTIDVTLESGDDIEYWWERHGAMLAPKQNAPQLPRPFTITYDITPMVTYADTGNYSCFAENSCVSVGGPVYLGLAPEILYQSEGFGGCFGIQGTLLVRSKGGPLNFVWEKGPTETGPWAKATRYNANDSTYVITSLANEDDGWYRCRVYNTHPTHGTLYTNPVKVTIVGNNAITQQPKDIWVCPDPPPRDTLKVSATGLGLRYAWFKTTTGVNDTLSKDSLLIFPAIVTTDIGTYWCEVYDSLNCSTVISSTADIGIFTPPYFTGDETETVYSCITLDTTLYAKGGGDNLRYIWKYDGIQQDPGDTLASYGPFEVSTADMGTRWTCDIYNECATIVQNFNIDVEIIPDITLTNMIDYYQCTGETINIPVTVSNSALSKPKYQWKKNSGNIYTGTDATLELNTLELSDTGYYSCLIYNRCTPRLDTVVQTDSSWVWVNTLEYQNDPYFLAGCLGDDYTFHIPAIYDSIYYVWRKNGIIVKGPDFEDPDYQFTNLKSSDAGVYDITISNRCGAKTTTATVSTNIPLAAITMPRDTTVALEGAATFVTTTNIQGSLISYQWYFKEVGSATWLELTGATNNTYVRPYVELQHEGDYRCRIYNECDDIYTTAAALGIYKPPAILTSPSDIAACEYDSVKLVVVASGDQIEYQWYFDGFQIPGATSDTYIIPKASMAEAGSYWVVVSSPLYPGKDVISDHAVVSVIERMVLACVTENSECAYDDNGSISVQLTEGLPPYAYYWTPIGATDSLIIDLSPDDYRVSVTDQSTCSLQKIIEVDEPDPLRLGVDSSAWVFGIRAGGQGYDKSNAIVSDSAGNTYVVGAFSATADIFGHSLVSYGQTDAFLAKFDIDGNNVWVKRAGGSSIDEYTGVAVDTLGNVYVTGFFNVWMHFGEDPTDPAFDLYSNGMNDMVIAKYNSDGDIVWFKNAGGVFEDFGQSIHSDLIGNTYIAGSFQGISTWGNITKTSKGSDDAFVAKYSTDGVVQWVNQMGSYSQDFANDVVVDISESCFVTGDFQDVITFDNGVSFTSNGMTDAFIAKYDFRGDFLWAKQIGGPLFDEGTSIDIDYTGNLFFTGNYQNEITVDARTLTSEGESDIFYGKIDFEDNLRWIKSAGSDKDDASSDLIVDVLGNQYITGTYGSAITFDTTTIACAGTSDFFVSKFNTEGHMVWLKQGGNNGADSASAITFAHSQVHHHLDSLYVTGTFTDSIQFGGDTLIASGNLTRNDIFYSRLRQVLTIQDAIIGNVVCHGQDSGYIEITVGGGTLPYTYEWTLENGAVVNTQDLYNIPDGTYKVKIIDANDCVLEKTFQVLYTTEPPLPPTHISSSTIETCPNSIDPVRLESFGGTGDTLFWHTGSCDGPIIGNGQVIWVLPTETTTYFSNWVNDCGTSQCASVTVTVIPYPDPPTSISVNNNYYCVADTVVITTVGGSGEKLQLYTGACGLENGGVLLGTGTPLSIPAPTVETTVYARWESGCGVNNYLYSSCVDITIYQAEPTSPPTLVTVDTNEFCDTWGGNITLTSTGGSGNELQWHIGSCFSGNIAGIGEVLTIPAPADTTTYYPGWINSCDSSCLPSITVNVKHTPEVPDYLVATPQQFCLDAVSDITIEAVGGFGDTLWIFKDIYFGPYPIGYTTTGSLTFPAPTETTTYVAGYSNPCGTSISTSITVTVYPLPEQVSFTGLDDSYCLNNDPVLLTGSNAPEGIFTGTGLTDIVDGTAIFNPAIAGVGGPYEIIYTYTNANGCVSDTSMFTTVNPLPVVDFTGLDAEYCANSIPDTLFGNSIGGGFTAEGLGTYLIDLGNDTAVFYPTLVSAPATVEISYYYTNLNGCSDTITKTAFVNALTEISFTNIDDTYCRANPALTIVGSESPNPNGIFNVAPYLFPNPGIPGEVVFDLEQAFIFLGGTGSVPITYTFTDLNGCVSDTTRWIEVQDFPTVTISNLDASYCSNNSATLITGSPLGGVFFGPGITDNGDGTALFDPNVAFNSGAGPYSITYSYTPIAYCEGSTTETVEVLPAPDVFISGLDTAYCIDSPIVTMTGSHATNYTFLCVPATPAFVDNGDGTATFDPATAGVNSFAITYSHTAVNGCQSDTTYNTRVEALPIPILTGMDVFYCLNSEPDTLFGNYSGGVISGPGVTMIGSDTALFDPSVAGVGAAITINYAYASPVGCFAEVDVDVEVRDLPFINFTGLEDAYCVDHLPVTITVIPGIEGGNFSGPGIEDHGAAGYAIFSPNVAGVGGPYGITYTYQAPNGCTNDTTIYTEVYELPEVSFTGLDANYCVDHAPVTLESNSYAAGPPYGVFSGPGITDFANGRAAFDPNIAGLGTHTILYHFTDVAGCENETTQTVTIDPIPEKPLQLIAIPDMFCLNSTDFITLEIAGGFGDSIQWFRDGCGINPIDTTITTTISVEAPSGDTWYFARWKNDCGVSECDSVQVIVKPEPIAPVDIIADTNYYCPETIDTVALTALGGWGDEVRWFVDGCGMTPAATNNVGVTFKVKAPPTPTWYYAYWWTDCDFTSDCDSILITPRDLAVQPDSITVDTNNFCQYDVTEITLTTHGGVGNYVNWYVGACGENIASGHTTQLTITPAPDTTTWYYATYNNECGESDCDSVEVIVREQPVVVDSITSDTNFYCQGTISDITLTGWGGSGTYLRWFNQSCGEGFFQEGLTATIPAPDVTSTYWARWENGCGESICDSIIIEVIPQPIPVDTIISDTNNICWNYPIDILLTAQGGSGTAVRWYKSECGGELINEGTNPLYITPPDTTTWYFASWINDCNETTCDSIQIFVNSPIIPDSVVADTNYICTSWMDDIRLISYGGTGDSIQWFADECGSDIIGTGDTIWVAPPDTTTVYYAHWATTCDTSSFCVSDTIFVIPDPTVPDTLIAQPDTICRNHIGNIALAAIGGYGDTISPYGQNVWWFKDACGDIDDTIGTGANFMLRNIPDTTTYYYAKWVNTCGESVCDSVRLLVSEPFAFDSVTVDNNDFCPGAFTELNFTTYGGYGDTTLMFSPTCGDTVVTKVPFGQLLTIPSVDTTRTFYFATKTECDTSDCYSVTIQVNVPVPADSVVADTNYICTSWMDDIRLISYGGTGDSIQWFADECGSDIIGTGDTIWVAPPDTTTVYYAQWATTCDTSSFCVTDTIFVIPDPTVPDTLIAQPDTVCLDYMGSIALTAVGGYGDTISPYGQNVLWFKDACGDIDDTIGTGVTFMMSDIPDTTTYYYAKWINTCGESVCDSLRLFVNTSYPFDSVTVDNNDFCPGAFTELNFTTYGGYGDTTLMFSPTCGDTLVTKVPFGQLLTIPSVDTTRTFYFATKTDCDTSDCYSVTIQVNVPVQADSVVADTNYICTSWMDDIRLISYGGTGDSIQWFADECGSDIIGTGDTIWVAPPDTTTVYYAQWATTCDTSSFCVTDTIFVIPDPIVPDTLIAQPDTVCLDYIGDIALIAIGGYGDTITPLGQDVWWFKDACGDIDDTIGTGETFMLSDIPDTTTYYYAKWVNTCGESVCDSLRLFVNASYPFDSVTVDNNDYCPGTLSELNFTTYGGYGDTTLMFSPTCGDTLVTKVPFGQLLTIPAVDTTRTFYFATKTDCDTSDCVPVTIRVNVPVPPDSVVADTNYICTSWMDDIRLIAYGGTGDSIQWFADECGSDIIGTGDTIWVTPPDTTTVYYAQWATTCDTSSFCVTDTIFVIPDPTVPEYLTAEPDTICLDQIDPILLTAIGGYGDTISPYYADVYWFRDSCGPAEDAIGVGQTLSLTTIPDTTTWYFAKWVNTCGESLCDSVRVFVNTAYPFDSATVNHNDFCPGDFEELIFTTYGGYGDTTLVFSPTCGDTLVGSMVFGQTLTVPAPDTTVTYYFATKTECDTSECIPLEVRVIRPLPVDSIVASDTSICYNATSPVALTAFGGQGETLHWYKDECMGEELGQGTTLSLAPPPDTTTTYFAAWESICGDYSACDEFTVNVIEIPIAPEFIEVSENNYCPGSLDTIFLVAHGGYGDTISPYGEQINWYGDFCNGTLIGTGDTLTLDPAPSSNITVFAQWENSCGISECTSVEIIMNLPEIVDSLTVDTNYFCPGNVQYITLEGHGGTGDGFLWYKDEPIGIPIGLTALTTVGAPDETSWYYGGWFTECDTIFDSILVVVDIPVMPGVITSDTNNICKYYEDPITLTANGGYGEYVEWFAEECGSTVIGVGESLIITPPYDETTTYFARWVNHCGPSDCNSFTLNVAPPPTVNAGMDTVVCAGLAVELIDAYAENYDSLQWYTNGAGYFSDSKVLNPIYHTEGVVVEEITDVQLIIVAYGLLNCEQRQDTMMLTIYPKPIISITPDDPALCRDSTILLVAHGANLYEWTPSETLSRDTGNYVYASPQFTTDYTLYGTTEFGCKDTLNFNVPVVNTPYVDLGKDLYLFSCDPIELNAGESTGNEYYEWSDGTRLSSLEVTESGTYWIRSWNEGCEIFDTIYVELCEGRIFMPNAFTPNGDGKNDVFTAVSTDNTVEFEMLIYSRDGSLVYKTDNIYEGWDGKNENGKYCPVGTYVYLVTYTAQARSDQGIVRTLSGTVTLIR